MAKFIDLTWQRFGELVVISRAENNKNGKAMWNTACDCGRVHLSIGASLRSGKTTNCSDGVHRREDLEGQKFGELTAVSPVKGKKWLCRCSCSKMVTVLAASLKRGNHKSCGHARRKVNVGERFHSIVAIKQRNKPDCEGNAVWDCVCDCSKAVTTTARALVRGDRKSCGCKRFNDLTGKKFNLLSVISIAERVTGKPAKYNCLCDCGKMTVANSQSLKNGSTKSCGHLRGEPTDATHGVIYRVTDCNGRTVYIGKTLHEIKKRLAEHINKAKRMSRGSRATSKFSEWINRCMDSGFAPEIKMIEIAPADFLDMREQYWINHFKDAGYDLKNTIHNRD